MSIFENKFFSVAGQKERLTNVVNVLKSSLNPFDKNKVVANVENKTAKAALEFVANNPYTTAGLATGATAIIKAPVAAAAKVAKVAISNPVKSSLAVVAVGAAAKSQTVRTTLIKSAGKLTPENLLQVGAKTGEFIDQPDKTPKDAFAFIKDVAPDATLPVLAAAAVVATPFVAPIVIDKVKDLVTPDENLLIDQPANEKILTPTTPVTSPASPAVSTRETTTLTNSSGKKRKRRSVAKAPASINQRVNVIVQNKNVGVRYINRRVYA